MAGFRVVRLVAAPAPRFAHLATPASPYVAATELPPAQCWRNPQHRAPTDGCTCGYHGFWDLATAVEFAALFTPLGYKSPPHRFVVRCIPIAPTDVGPVDPTAPPAVFRAASVRHVSLYLPRVCTCARPAIGVAPLAPTAALDRLDAAGTYPVLAGACARHTDTPLTTALAALLPFE